MKVHPECQTENVCIIVYTNVDSYYCQDVNILVVNMQIASTELNINQEMTWFLIPSQAKYCLNTGVKLSVLHSALHKMNLNTVVVTVWLLNPLEVMKVMKLSP